MGKMFEGREMVVVGLGMRGERYKVFGKRV
jgi:hypothetical protein